MNEWEIYIFVFGAEKQFEREISRRRVCMEREILD
jgi:hypothetical protein